MRTNRIFSLLTVSALLAAACSSNHAEPDELPDGTSGVSQEQKQLANVKTGLLKVKRISSVISCTGEIEVPPQGMASVTAPLGGFIVETDIVPGTYVKKGTLLATLSNPEYIVLQQSYLETAGQLKFAGQDYARQKMLEEQNATAVKKLQESESSYTVLKARLAGLKEQLRMIGINFKALDNGVIQSVTSLRAPMAGYVTNVNHHPGQFVEPREVIFEIVNMNDLHLHLNVFEQDIARVQKGLSVRFRPSGTEAETYWGTVLLISPQRNEVSRTFDVHGHIIEEDERLKPGMYVEAEILFSDDSVYAMPIKAVVNHENESFVITEENGRYAIEAVETGAKMDGWVEIRDHESLANKTIVTEGASRLFTALRKED